MKSDKMQINAFLASQEAIELKEEEKTWIEKYLNVKYFFILEYEKFEEKERIKELYRHLSNEIGLFYDIVIEYDPYLKKEKGTKGVLLRFFGKIYVVWASPNPRTQIDIKGLKAFVPMTQEEINKNKKLREKEKLLNKELNSLFDILRENNSLDEYEEVLNNIKTIKEKFQKFIDEGK